MSLNNTSIDELFELYNSLFHKNYSYDDWVNDGLSDDEIREVLVEDIKFGLEKLNYDGNDDYNSMFWFVKGNNEADQAWSDMLNIGEQPLIKHLHVPHAPKHPRQPKRYDQSDEYLFNTRKRNYQRMLDDLINNKPILRPLPPTDMKPLTPYHQKLFEANNNELIDFFQNFGHDFNSKDVDYLIVNEPHDYSTALNVLKQHQSKYNKDHEIVTKNKNKDPIIMYYLNKFTSLNDIFDFLNNVVFKSERKPFKLTFELSGVFETPIRENEEVTRYEYDNRIISAVNYKYHTNIPIVIQMNADLDKIKYYIETVLHNYEVSESSVKLTFVSSVGFSVHRMVKVAGRIESLPEEVIKSKLIITDNEDDGLCWYRFLAICVNPKLIKMKMIERTKQAKRLICDYHGCPYKTQPTYDAKEFLNNYEGTTWDEMKERAKHYKINVNIYEYIEDGQYDIVEQWFFDESFDTHNALVFSKGGIVHIMYIKNAEKLTKILICPKCHSYCVRNDNRHGEKRMKKHEAHCNGEFKKEFISEKVSLPYCPHILNNPVYEYCLAHCLTFKPQQYYITYDFETMEQVINKTITKATTVNSRLIPLSVSCCIKSSTGTMTKHFDARNKNFIVDWLKFMFEQAVNVVIDKIKFYKSMLNTDDVALIKSIVPDLNTITVFGFNSARFDSNLFKEFLNYKSESFEWTVDNNSLIGSATALKQFIIYSKTTQSSLRFIDAQSFVAGGTLKQFGKDFGGVDNSNKGVFPYEAINDENFNEILSQTQPFEHKDFYSSLQQRLLINDDEYEKYKDDAREYYRPAQRADRNDVLD